MIAAITSTSGLDNFIAQYLDSTTSTLEHPLLPTIIEKYGEYRFKFWVTLPILLLFYLKYPESDN